MTSESEKLIRFQFQEELALRDSLYSVGTLVLKSVVAATGAQSAVFLYAAPGMKNFEKVSSIGLKPEEEKRWAECSRKSDFALPEAIRTQKQVELKISEKTTVIAFPLMDADIAAAGFCLIFEPAKFIDPELRLLLNWMAEISGQALFNNLSEGV